MSAIPPPLWRWARFGQRLARSASKSRHSKSGEQRTSLAPSRRLKAQADALYVVGDPLVGANRTRIMTFSLTARLPTIFNTRDHVQAGGLMSYGPNFPAQLRRAADFVDKILRGTKPSDIPVEQPIHFELVINLTTAKALGLSVPPTLLALADEIIE